MTRVSRQSCLRLGRIALVIAALAAPAGVVALAACGSSGTAESASPPGAKTAAITAVLPKDVAAEPPWNGRFVQVTVQAPSPEKLAASDWSVFVDGKERALASPPNILPFAPDRAMVAFVFREPFVDLRGYRFRVVYSPKGGPKVDRSWQYDWAP